MMLVQRVNLTKNVKKDLLKAPQFILRKFRKWVGDIEKYGLEEVRKIRGWSDHSLQGDRLGQRAISLNIQWRAIYELSDDGEIYVNVLEVNPHEYKK